MSFNQVLTSLNGIKIFCQRLEISFHHIDDAQFEGIKKLLYNQPRKRSIKGDTDEAETAVFQSLDIP